MKSQRHNRRTFLAAAGSTMAAVPPAAAQTEPAARVTSGLIDCQSHLFFPGVLDMMRKRKTEPLVYDQGGPAATEAKILRDNARQLFKL